MMTNSSQNSKDKISQSWVPPGTFPKSKRIVQMSVVALLCPVTIWSQEPANFAVPAAPDGPSDFALLSAAFILAAGFIVGAFILRQKA